MSPVLLAPEEVIDVTAGSASLSFDLPRFGISLLTLAPAGDGASRASDAGCSCRSNAAPPSPLSALMILSLLGCLARRRGRPQRSRRAGAPEVCGWPAAAESSR
jgi:hypothetical protein